MAFACAMFPTYAYSMLNLQVVENSIYARPPDARSPKVWFILIHYVKMMIQTHSKITESSGSRDIYKTIVTGL